MTKDDFIRLAREAGWDYANDSSGYDPLWKFGELVAASEREWQGLTDDEYELMAENHVTNCYFDTLTYAKAIEAKLKEKNEN